MSPDACAASGASCLSLGGEYSRFDGRIAPHAARNTRTVKSGISARRLRSVTACVNSVFFGLKPYGAQVCFDAGIRGALARVAYCQKHDGREYADDGDDDQKLYEGKAPRMHACIITNKNPATGGVFVN